jgi:amino acid adenylation domain-containing protein
MVLFAAFVTLLFRYSGQRDLIVGTPIANRNRTELEDLIGFFANTLAIRSDLSGDPTFRELVRRVRLNVLDAYANQDLPFEQLVSEINPERTLSHTPLFQVLFQLQTPIGHGGAELPELRVRNVELERNRAKFDLGLFMMNGPDGLRTSLEYSADLFDRSTVERMIGHLETLLPALAADPDQRIESARLLTAGEEDTLREWNATATAYPETPTRVHELVEAQTARAPERPAVQFRGTTLTYGELNERANRVAWHLRELGVRPDVPVGISLERSPDLLVAVLAVLKAGGAYCPLDPGYPQERLRYMLEDSAPAVVLTHSALVGRLPSTDAHVLCLDEEAADAFSGENPPPVGTPDNLAYVLFTSGSTGRPKGVAMPHRPLTNLVEWQRRHFSSPPDARTLQFASLSFDVAFQEVFSTWNCGGTLILIDDDTRRDAEALLMCLQENDVERLFIPFAGLQHLAEAALEFDIVPLALREVITAGEALQATPAIREFFARLDGCVLHNHYGPTESHVVTVFTLTGEPSEWPSRPPIGKPIANARVYVLDDHRKQVPVGVPGELYIGGPVLARGYLNKADLTDQRFVSDPLDETGANMYRTGDRGRFLPSGAIEFLGRADDQVKVRGYRVEPGEVEAVLLEHPGVREAAVVAAKNDSGDQLLVGYTVSDREPSPSSGELRDFLRDRLPDFMIPSAFVALEKLPLSPNGKVDRSALPAWGNEEVEDVFLAPRSPTESTVAAIWAEVLGVDRVGANDNFFHLGGHSLLATRVISRIRKAFDVEIGLRSLFEEPTVAGLAAVVENCLATEQQARGPVLTPVDRRRHQTAPAQSADSSLGEGGGAP